MSEGWSQQEKDILAVVFLAAAIGVGGTFSLYALLSQFETWLLSVGVLLRGNNLVIELPGFPGVGLDWTRLIVLAGIILALMLAAVFAIATLRRRSTAGRA